MVIEELEKKIEIIEDHLDYLEEVKDIQRSEFLKDPERIKAVKYSLKGSMDGCLEIARQLIESETIIMRGGYSDMFAKLNDEGIISERLSKNIVYLIRSRTKLDPLYGEISDEEVWSFMNEYTDDIKDYIENIRNLTN